MIEKKPTIFKSPNLSKMQVVVIDAKTKIYIAAGDDPIEAKSRYLSRLESRNKVYLTARKPAAQSH